MRARSDGLDLVTYDVAQGNAQPFAAEGLFPAWSPSGEWLYFSGTDDSGEIDIYRGRVASTIPPERLLAREKRQYVTDVGADRLLFHENDGLNSDSDIWALSLEDGAEPELVVGGPATTAQAVFSPDGRWIAYGSEEGGLPEIWVQEFPGEGQKRKVSGGEYAITPVWNGAGLFYDSLGWWMVVDDRDPGPGFSPAPPRRLERVLWFFEGRHKFDVSPDGTRALVPRPVTASRVGERPSLQVVLNWLDQVKRRAPTE